LPDGWKTYETIGSSLVVAYPPDWSIEKELIYGVRLSFTNDTAARGLLVSALQFEAGAAADAFLGYDQQVSTLKQLAISMNPGRGNVTFSGEGTLATNEGQAYVIASTKGGTSNGELLWTFAHQAGAENDFALVIFSDSPPVGTEAFSTDSVDVLSQIVQFMRWGQEKSPPKSLPRTLDSVEQLR
jgi:hypothetical protein